MAYTYPAGVPSPLDHSDRGKDNRCINLFEETTRRYGPLYHLHTDGNLQSVLFSTPEEYVFGMNLVAICANKCPRVKIITFELMSNHVHFILYGRPEDIDAFFKLFKKRLQRYFSSIKKVVDLSRFDYKLVSITSIESLRNQIAYTNRNGYLVHPEHTPFSYPYGANSHFFSHRKPQTDCTFEKLTYRERRALLKSHDNDIPPNFFITDGYISPLNYCLIKVGEQMFRDAHNYYRKVSQNIESFKEIANMLSDQIFYTDDELSAVVFNWCRKNGDGLYATQLSIEKKQELARVLHFDYNADNGKIGRLLRISEEVLKEMFPTR